MSKLFRKSKKGFTLVELIVVIAIIGVLAAIIVPTTLHFVNEGREQAANETVNRVRDAINNGLTQAVVDGKTISAATIDEILAEANIGVTDPVVNIAISAAIPGSPAVGDTPAVEAVPAQITLSANGVAPITIDIPSSLTVTAGTTSTGGAGA